LIAATWPKADMAELSFEYFVSAGEQGWGAVETRRRNDLEIDHQFDLGALLDRPAGLAPLKILPIEFPACWFKFSTCDECLGRPGCS
jgi:hypothetical protein